MSRIESRLNRLEAAMKKDKLELQLITGDSILLDNSDLLSLFNESISYIPVKAKNGEVHFPAAQEELSDNMLSVMYAEEGQDPFIDNVKKIMTEYKEATE